MIILKTMQSVNLIIPSSTGIDMAATIDFPNSPPKAFAIFAHCFAGSRHTPGAARTSKQLATHGIATLRFDFPGLGQSGGDFADTSFSQNVDDILAAANYLSAHHEAPQLLVGHSLGGAAALAAASQIPSLKAVATLGAPFDPAHSVLHYADKIGEVDAGGAVEVTLGGQSLTISRGFLEDLAETNPQAYLARLRKPVLLLHSPLDQTVGIDNAQNIFRSTRYPKSLMTLDKADHLLTRQGTAARAADLIAQWALPYFTVTAAAPQSAPDAAVTHLARGTKMAVVATSGAFEVTVDRPKGAGGKGEGFSALGLAASALAAATTQAIRAAAARMAVEDIRVTVEPDGSTPPSFVREILIKGEVTAEQLRTLEAAVDNHELAGVFRIHSTSFRRAEA